MTNLSTTPTTPTTDPDVLGPERRDLLEALATHRSLLRGTARGLSDDQARHRPTVSDLSIGGVVKHVATTERHWAGFMVTGHITDGGVDVNWKDGDPAAIEAYLDGFRMQPGETLEQILADYEAVAAATDELVATIDLDATHPLPAAPWWEPGATWSARRTVLHIVAETAQHAGHADIIREAIDGQKSMG